MFNFRVKTLLCDPTMSSPAKDLPKIADQLKGEILAEHSLKPTEAQEKNVLPSADDVKQEKNHQNIMTGTASQTDRQTDRQMEHWT